MEHKKNPVEGFIDRSVKQLARRKQLKPHLQLTLLMQDCKIPSNGKVKCSGQKRFYST